MKHALALPVLLPVLAQAADTVPTSNAAATAGSFFQVLIGLIVVLGLMAFMAWMMKRFNIARVAGNAPVKIVGGVSVGNRERVMVVEVADQWIVVGVATGQVTALSTMPRPANLPAAEPAAADAGNFAHWLKQQIEKRNAK
ncbi:MAG: flagellar biosynthetic protein FliO [Proteobacteria bacterium]|nr:flagellar biosynthetic protein FliO [Pseudomonadota bacterium]